MRLLAWAGLWLLALSGSSAAAQDSAGTYVAEEPEMASALELLPEGRFRWGLSYGALDMLAEGRWRQEADGAVILDTEPPVRPPDVSLVGNGREEVPALIVRIAGPRGETPPYLDVEAEYDSGEPGYAYLEDDAYRFEPSPGRRIRSLRVIVPFAFYRSEPIAVPADANVVRLSFAPNDLGRGDFRGERAVRDGDALVLNVLGSPLRYRRLNPEEQAQYGNIVSDIEAEAGGGSADEEPGIPIEAVPLTGPVEIAIGEPLAPHVVSTLPDYGAGLYATTAAIPGLRYRFGGRAFDFGSIGGEPQLYFGVNTGRDGRTVTGLTFSYQERLLTLGDALERARRLEGWLREGGFERRPRPPEQGPPESDPFAATAMIREGDVVPGRAGDWAGAERLLADEGVGIVTMHLFTLKSGEVHVSAFVESLRRLGLRDQGETPLPVGAEWLLNIVITRDPALLSAEMFEEPATDAVD